jgi:uncharacterized membrane protein
MINKNKKRTLPQTIGYLLTILGLVGLLAAFTLAIEKVAILKNPSYTPSCNISPLLSCGSVMTTPQAEVFGFPNPFMGIVGFSIVTTIGVAVLAGAQFKRWFWLGLQAGTTLGLIFVGWLYYQSVFTIGALCPYCMIVWAVTIPLFWYVLLYNITQDTIVLKGRLLSIGLFMQRHHGDILLLTYLFAIGIILQHFWYYWSTLL